MRENGSANESSNAIAPAMAFAPIQRTAPQKKEKKKTDPFEARPFYSICELADRWHCSRASVYNRIRGEKVVDFAAKGRKGNKIVPLEIVLKIERSHLRELR
jgi:hypothetical protein